MKSIRFCPHCQCPWSRHVARCPGCGQGAGWDQLLWFIAWAAVALTLLALMAGGKASP